MGAAHERELTESPDPEHRREFPDVGPVGATRVRVVDVGEPLGRHGHFGQLLGLRSRDQPAPGVASDRQPG